MKAIDLYAGVGGWALGLKLAGIDVTRSFEWWQPAVTTHNKNLGSDNPPENCRAIDLSQLERGSIDVVVGSPPCTEFSYSNRGGSGDISEGLNDLLAFFRVVDHVRPRFWAMENVPRVAEILRRGFADPEHPLHAYRHLRPTIEVLDASEYGVPQGRKRCIAGSFPFELLHAYKAQLAKRTLGDVVGAIAGSVVVDPVWGVSLSQNQLTETEKETPLNPEELRMNRDSKLHHPVYNNMAFPDRLDEPARTVTATCTRVSRESIVIEDPRPEGNYRRLTIRERACLQGFPITYQFFGNSFPEKAKMVGNAIPPPLTFLIGQAMKRVAPEALPSFERAGAVLTLPSELPNVTPPDAEGKSYPMKRGFRAALRELRFKSGMRFDLSNDFTAGVPTWRVRFFFGPSKDIREVLLDEALWSDLLQSDLVRSALPLVEAHLSELSSAIAHIGPQGLQDVWTRRAEGLSPFDLTDRLSDVADQLHRALLKLDVDEERVGSFVLRVADEEGEGIALPGAKKLAKNALRILSGYVVGSWFNQVTEGAKPGARTPQPKEMAA